MKHRRVWLSLALVTLVAGFLFARSHFFGAAATRSGTTGNADTVATSRSTVPPPRARDERSLDLDDDRAGTIRLEGQVIDAGVRPVGGATVTIDSRPTRTAVTEADGSFAFDGLIGRGYELVATSGELVAGPLGVQVTERTEPVVLRLANGAVVDVDVVAARGQKAINAARIQLHGPLDRDATTDANGHATFKGIAPGWYVVVATAPNLAPATTFVGVGNDDATNVRLELVTGAGVAGRVIDPDGKPVAAAKVRYEGVSDWTQSSTDSITTAADGTFRIAALPAGSFRFSARDDDHAPGATSAVVLDGTTAREDLVIQLQPGGTLTGVVVDANKRPVPWARVRAREEAQGIAMQRTRQTTADADGTFRLSGLPRSVVNIVALGDETTSSTARADLAATPDARVELVLDLSGIIAGHVVDSSGEPIEGAQVWAAREDESASDAGIRGESFALTDGSGGFAFHGLAGGRYQIHTNPPGAKADLSTLVLREEVKANVGDRDVRVVLPADGAITGKVVLAEGGSPAMFTLSLGAWGSGITVATKDGAFKVSDVPPRQYRLTIRGATFAETTLDAITIAPGKTVDLGTITVRKGRSISGRVVDSSGAPIAGATVSAGPTLWGTGSRASAPPGMSGPPGSSDVKQTKTNERGEFSLVGVSRTTRVIIAEHDAHGRSQPLALASLERSLTDLQLSLVAFGALEGKVTIAGAPGSRMIVNAQSKTVPTAMYSVISGEDGGYRFDRLAPDTYSVSAMMGADPMSGFGFHTKTVTVASGKPAHLDLAVDAGDVTLVVRTTAAKPVMFAMVYSIRGTLSATNAKELEQKTLALEAGQSSFGMGIAGQPAKITKLAPGTYTICASPFPAEVGVDVEDYLVREGDRLPVFCKGLQIGATPKEQAIDIAVEIPAFVPPDDGA